MHPRGLRCSSLTYSRIPDVLGRRALPAGRLASLGATPDLPHGLLGRPQAAVRTTGVVPVITIVSS